MKNEIHGSSQELANALWEDSRFLVGQYLSIIDMENDLPMLIRDGHFNYTDEQAV